MPEYKVILTWEAVYDVTDIAEYIEAEFGKTRADCFQSDIQKELAKLEYMGSIFPEIQIWYRGYAIHKKLFSPSIIFYVFKEAEKEVHVLRVLREEQDWEHILSEKREYTYPDE